MPSQTPSISTAHHLLRAQAVYRLRRLREKILLRLIWSLPKTLVYWCAIRVWANATQGQWGLENPTTVTFDTALKRWGDFQL